jgi:hypothetical protein
MRNDRLAVAHEVPALEMCVEHAIEYRSRSDRYGKARALKEPDEPRAMITAAFEGGNLISCISHLPKAPTGATAPR